MRKCTIALFTVLLPAVCCAQGKFLDVVVVQVRGDQTVLFDALARKMADANRKAKDKGDFWIAYQDYYGTSGRTYFVAPRAKLDDVTQAEGSLQRRHVSAGEKLGTSGIANGSWHLHLGLLLDGHVDQDDWDYILHEDEVRAVLGGYRNGQHL